VALPSKIIPLAQRKITDYKWCYEIQKIVRTLGFTKPEKEGLYQASLGPVQDMQCF